MPHWVRARKVELVLLAMLLLLSSAAFFQGVTVDAQATPNVLAPTVTGSINTSNPGTEAFWSQITPVQIPVTGTDDYGGSVKSVSVKIATNGTSILFSATWSDPSKSIQRVSGGPATPANYPGLFFANGTIHGFDQFAVWWSLNQNPGPPPCMQVGAPGKGGPASLAGTGNLWRWVASSTDSGGPSFPTAKYGAGTPQAGHLINYTHSFARDMLLNTTGFFTLGFDSTNINATVGYGENHAPYNSQVVWAKGTYNNSTKSWTLIAARPLTTTPSTNIAQFTQGKTLYFALGAWDGGAHQIPAGTPAPAGWTQMADDSETKSISTWYTVALAAPGQTGTTSATSTSQQPPATVTVTSTNVQTTTLTVTEGPGFENALLASVGTLIVGLVAGMLAISRRTR